MSDERAGALEDGLTDQERRVALSVGRGATTKATARELGISSKTVDFHLGNIYRKLDLSGRAELAHLVGTRAGASATFDELLGRRGAFSMIDGHDSIEDFVASLVDRGSSRAATGTASVENPYKGLRAFEEIDAPDFFGRSRLVKQILDVMSGPGGGSRFLAVVGPSGSGKSSVVRAGLVPALRRGALDGSEQWRVALMVPGSDPLGALEVALDGVGAAGSLRDGSRAAQGDVIVVVDQFEELYTLCNDEARDEFVTALADAVAVEHGALRAVVALRADFFDRPLGNPRLAALVGAGMVPVPPLGPDELESAIVGPAHRAGVRIEPGLAAVLAADTHDQPGTLPLVQFALTDTFDRREGDVLTIDAYRAIGGVTGAVARSAEDLYLTSNDHEQDVTRRLFTRLVTPSGVMEDTGRRVLVRELPHDRALAGVLDRYGRARLLSFDRDARTGSPTVQLAHEALIREWPRLQGWLEADREGRRVHRDLTIRASAWEEAGRDDGELYRGGRLAVTEQWATDHAPDLNPVETEFLDASVAQRRVEEDAQRRNDRRIRRGLALVAVVAVVAVVAGAIAWRQQGRASSAAREAARERDGARAAEFASETGRLAALAPTLAKTSPALSLLLAAEAERRIPGPEAWGALQQAIVAVDTTIGFLTSSEPLREAFYDGHGGIVGIGDTTVTAWAADTHRLVQSTQLPARLRAPVYTDDHQEPVAFAGDTLAWVADDDTAHLVDLTSGDHRTVDMTGADNVAFDSSAARLVVVSRAGDVTMYRLPELTVAWAVKGSGPRSVKAAGEEVGVAGMPPELDNYPIIAEVVFGAGDSTVVVARGWSVTTLDAETGTQRASAAFPMPVTGLTIESAAQHRLLALSTHHVAAAELPALSDVTSIGLDSQLPVYEVDLAGVPDGRVVALNGQGEIFVVASGSLSEPAPPPGMSQPPPSTSAVVETLQAHAATARAITLSPDGTTALIAGESGASLVRVDGGGLSRRAVPRPTDHSFFLGGHDAAWVASTPPVSSEAPEVLRAIRSAPRVWSCAQSLCVEQDLGLDPAKEVYAEPSSDMLVTFTNLSLDKGTWRFYDGPSMQPRSPEIEPETRLGGLAAIAPDRAWVAIANLDTSLEIFEPATGKLLNRFPAASWGVEAPGVSPLPNGDELVVFSHTTGDSYVLDVLTGERRPSPVDEAASVTFSRTGNLVATVAPAGEVSVRDGTSFSVLHRLPNTDPFLSMAFSDDDRFLVTTHPTGGRLWDVTSGRPIGELIPTLATTAPTALPGQATHLLTASNEWVQIWDLAVDTWRDLACLAAGRNLTRTEWEQVGPRDQDYRATCVQWPLDG